MEAILSRLRSFSRDSGTNGVPHRGHNFRPLAANKLFIINILIFSYFYYYI